MRVRPGDKYFLRLRDHMRLEHGRGGDVGIGIKPGVLFGDRACYAGQRLT